ncbi:3-hydroxyacyl-CoA dehydrogenase NAD-binding domain-containing protein [Serratia ureilytica]
MGRGIAYLFAQKGIRTVLYNRNGNTLNQAREYIAQDLNKKVEQGKIALQDKGAVLANLVFTSVFETIADSELVIETIAEQEQTKLEVLAAIAAAVKPDTLIATNTSSLSLNKLATAVTHSERFIGLHFFNPAPLMKLIEIIPAYFTARATTERCRQLVAALGKRDVVCQATPGLSSTAWPAPTTWKGSACWKNTWRARRRSTAPSRPAGTFAWGRSS